jgi:hypothetical protein
MGWTARVRFPPVQDLSLLHSVHTGSAVHPDSYPKGTGVKRPAREGSAQINKSGVMPPHPHIPSRQGH